MALTPSGDFSRYLAQYYYTKTELQAGALSTIYFTESEFIATSAGAGDAGKPIKLNSSGVVDSTMIAGGSLATHMSDTSTHGVAVAIVGTTDTQTLTNKTLTTPVIGSGGFQNAQHTHVDGGEGGQIAHTSLTSIGTNTHDQIDTHIAATTGHGATGAVVGTTNTQTLTNKTLTDPLISTVYGGSAANGDIDIRGTSSATKTTSYVKIQADGGKTVVGGSDTDYNFEIQNRAADDYRVAYRLNNSGINEVYSYSTAPGGANTLAPYKIQASNVSLVGQVNFATTGTPASASSSGTTGNFAWDTSYIYIAVASNTWKRVAISTW